MRDNVVIVIMLLGLTMWILVSVARGLVLPRRLNKIIKDGTVPSPAVRARYARYDLRICVSALLGTTLQYILVVAIDPSVHDFLIGSGTIVVACFLVAWSRQTYREKIQELETSLTAPAQGQ
jgi:hypothetical protein